ncbi:MAG TPA: signal peptidase II [Bryobacteraceae bacterium]|jgi:signal peptidase II|nr:signal peptidase II [Bryobacteraceae bacterium]
MNPRLRTAAIAAAVVVVDRITKMYIRSEYTSWDVTPVIGGFFNIVHTENPGAAFGILADSPSAWSSMLLVGVSLIVMAVIGVMLWRPRPNAMQSPGLVSVGLALVFGGAVGNVWDRLFSGTVTDFLQVFFGSYEFPSFNAADSAITVGAALLLIDLWLTRHQHHTEHG